MLFENAVYVFEVYGVLRRALWRLVDQGPRSKGGGQKTKAKWGEKGDQGPCAGLKFL